MKFIERIKSLFRRKSSKPPTPRTGPIYNLWRQLWRRTADYRLENSELIFSAVSRIANALSAMPLQLYKGSKPVTNSELAYVMTTAPNGTPTCQFLKTMEACRGTAGDAYALKILDENMQLERLEILDPVKVTPVLEKSSNEVWYKVTPDEGKEIYYHSWYIIHIPFISTTGQSKSISPVSVLCNTLDYNEKMQQFSLDQLDKGINAQIVVEAPANLGEAQRTDTVNTLMDAYAETGGNVLLLESGLTAKALNLSPVDSKVFDAERISRSRVAMVYNIPPHLMGDYSDTSYTSQEQQSLEFQTLTMLPIVTAYEAEFNLKLLSKSQRKRGYHWEINMDAILRADAATRADVNQKAIRGGWKKINEVRASYGDAPDPHGDKLLVARDLTTLESLIKFAAQEPKAPEPPKQEKPDAEGEADE